MRRTRLPGAVSRFALSSRCQRSQPLHSPAAMLPAFVKPQLSKLVKVPPAGPEWLHEIKFDGYRMHARLDHSDVQLLTRTGVDWTRKYPSIAHAVKELLVSQPYVDDELCGVRPDGTISFDLVQTAHQLRRDVALVFFLFDLLFVDGEDLTGQPRRAQGAPRRAADGRRRRTAIQRSSTAPRTGVF